MPRTTFRYGDFTLAVDFDSSTGMYVGSISNRPYAIRLSGNSPVQVRMRFVALFDRYLGVDDDSDRKAA